MALFSGEAVEEVAELARLRQMSDVDPAHGPPPVDQHHGGHRAHPVAHRHRAPVVEHGPEVVARLADERPDTIRRLAGVHGEDREGEEEHELREPGARRASCGAAMYGFGQLVHPTGAWSSFIDRAPLEL